jgi:tetratricopeptide (TPR) repeat protein
MVESPSATPSPPNTTENKMEISSSNNKIIADASNANHEPSLLPLLYEHAEAELGAIMTKEEVEKCLMKRTLDTRIRPLPQVPLLESTALVGELASMLAEQKKILRNQLTTQTQILSLLQSQETLLSSTPSELLLTQHEQLLKAAKEAIQTQQALLEGVGTGLPVDVKFVENQIKQHEQMIRAAQLLKQQHDFLQNQAHFLPKLDSNTHVRNGNDLKDAGKFTEAVEEYSKAIELDPINPFLYYLRAVAHENIPVWSNVLTDLHFVIHLILQGNGSLESMSFKATGDSGGDMLVTIPYLFLMALGFRVVSLEEIVTATMPKFNPELINMAKEDVGMFLAGHRLLKQDDQEGVFQKYLSAYMFGRVLLSYKTLLYHSGQYPKAHVMTLSIITHDARSDFYEFDGDLLRSMSMYGEAARAYVSAAGRNKGGGTVDVRLKYAGCLARGGRSRDAWYSFDDIQKRLLRGDFTLPDDSLLYNYLDGIGPVIPESMGGEQMLNMVTLYLFQQVNGEGTILGEPGVQKRKKKRINGVS